jgi:signal transduction histidine kinase
MIPMLNRSGRTIGTMLVLRDMTEEHQIQQTRETITETLIHDLRSPLTAVRAALEILSDTAQEMGITDELALQALSLGQSNSQKVLRLVNSLLEIARMQSGEIELELQDLDLHGLVDQVLKNYTILANEYGVFLSNDIPPNFPAARADMEKLERVLSNLVDNALKYTPAGGKVSISAETGDDQQLILRVSDNGPGIPDEYRDKIFERFRKIPNQPARRHGTGLGLAFCRLVIEAHGGKIWVEPNQPIGSTFALTLPAANQHP